MLRHVADTSPTILLKFVTKHSYFDCILDAPHNLFTSVQLTVVYTDTNSMESDDHFEVDDVFPTGTLLKKRSRDYEEEERNQEEGTSESFNSEQQKSEVDQGVTRRGIKIFGLVQRTQGGLRQEKCKIPGHCL